MQSPFWMSRVHRGRRTRKDAAVTQNAALVRTAKLCYTGKNYTECAVRAADYAATALPVALTLALAAPPEARRVALCCDTDESAKYYAAVLRELGPHMRAPDVHVCGADLAGLPVFRYSVDLAGDVGETLFVYDLTARNHGCAELACAQISELLPVLDECAFAAPGVEMVLLCVEKCRGEMDWRQHTFRWRVDRERVAVPRRVLRVCVVY